MTIGLTTTGKKTLRRNRMTERKQTKTHPGSRRLRPDKGTWRLHPHPDSPNAGMQQKPLSVNHLLFKGNALADAAVSLLTEAADYALFAKATHRASSKRGVLVGRSSPRGPGGRSDRRYRDPDGGGQRRGLSPTCIPSQGRATTRNARSGPLHSDPFA